MGHRWAKGVVWAQEGQGPGFGSSRPRGAKREGLVYERKLAAALPKARHGVWWEFMDANGRGWCQTDLVLVRGGGVVVLESKLSWVAEGHTQLEQLYRPVVEKAMGVPVMGGAGDGALAPGDAERSGGGG